MKHLYVILAAAAILIGCKKDSPKKIIDSRTFKMGFTSWSYGPTLEAVNTTYDFIASNGDVYAEHLDNKIPWDAWMNGTDLPLEFKNLVQGKVDRKPIGSELLLSVSFLNGDRSHVMEDFDGMKPDFTLLSDSALIEAYFKHVSYLVDELQPTYLVYSIESNELFINSPELWTDFRELMDTIGIRLKQKYPDLEMAESVTLHNWYLYSGSDLYLNEIEEIANAGSFAAISFYPFFKQLDSKNDFQKAFDFLHSKVDIPVAFVETNHIAENLIVDAYSIDIKGDEKEQEAYLETLLLNAHSQNYKFIIWWAYRDFDALWETFPEEVKDLGKLWRDTGLQDEDGNNRKSMKLWLEIFAK